MNAAPKRFARTSNLAYGILSVYTRSDPLACFNVFIFHSGSTVTETGQSCFLFGTEQSETALFLYAYNLKNMTAPNTITAITVAPNNPARKGRTPVCRMAENLVSNPTPAMLAMIHTFEIS